VGEASTCGRYCQVGVALGLAVGSQVGLEEVGARVGSIVGPAVGRADGGAEGFTVGTGDGGVTAGTMIVMDAEPSPTLLKSKLRRVYRV
jgi:hypothetical protein